MSEPFLSEIRIMSFNFPPTGWALCNGQLLLITQNQALFSLLGTTYGGDGVVNFALPNLQGRVPIHFGGGHTLGDSAGQEQHTLTIPELPAHTHATMASSLDGDQPSPAGNLLAGTANAQLYSSTATNLEPLLPATISSVGGSQSHENRQPFLVLNFCIALQGIFPSAT
jgi:microcystin-dependent protein